MSKIKFDKDDIEVREFVVFEDLVFFSHEDLYQYIESCDAELLTDKFFPEALELILQRDLDIDELRANYEDDDDFEEAKYRYNEEVDMLMDEFEIRYNVKVSRGMTTYRLLGNYANLKKFCSKYCADLAWTTPGEALSEEFENEVIVDIESGDMKHVIFTMYEK